MSLRTGKRKRSEKRQYLMARTYLGQYAISKKHLERIELKIFNLRSLLTDNSMHLSDAYHGNGRGYIKNRQETLAAEIDELEREAAEARQKADSIRIEIGETICKIEDPIVQKVLMLHYLESMSLSKTARKINYGKTHTFRLNETGLSELERLLK